MNKFHFGPRHGNVSIAQLMVAVGLASAVAVIVSKVSENSSSTARRAMDGFQTTAMRDSLSAIAKDPARWLPYQLRADALLSSSVLSNCLRKDPPFACPADEAGIDPSVRMEAGSRTVTSVNLYSPNRWNPAGTLVAADFRKIAGTEAHPAYFDRDGSACAGVADPKCLRRVTAYFIRQNASGDPNSILFIVRIDQNPATLAKNPNEFRTTYTRINVGKMWKSGGAGPVPVGSILPFAGSEAQVPVGYVLCNGAQYDGVTDYPQLYAVLGTRWTPPGAAAPTGNKFYVPDLRGQYLRGLDTSSTGTAVDPDRATRTVGSFQLQGADAAGHTHAAASGTVAGGIPASIGGPHTRNFTPVSAAGVSARLPGGAFANPGFHSGASVFGGGGVGPSGSASGGASGSVALGPSTATVLASGGALLHSFQPSGSTTATNLTSPAGTGVETRPPSAWVHYIIRVDY